MGDIKVARHYDSQLIWADVLNANTLLKPSTRYFAVVDSSVKWIYTEFFRDFDIQCYMFNNPTEKKKTLETINRIHNILFRHHADRSSVLLVIGGGLTLDVGGFAASTYKRGIQWIALPTTLLAQVDASVGGKTAVNHKMGGKNSIGSFYPPFKVIITPIVSQTWEDYHRFEGIAEMYKIFMLFDHLSAKKLVNDSLDHVLTKRSIELKIEVVKVDPWEKNLRAVLNYGHTFGHAIEHITGMRHGIAVALGIRIANIVSNCRGIMLDGDRLAIESDLTKLGFSVPSKLPSFDDIFPFLLHDKKNIDESINMCLINGKDELPMEPTDFRAHISTSELKNAYNLLNS